MVQTQSDQKPRGRKILRTRLPVIFALSMCVAPALFAQTPVPQAPNFNVGEAMKQATPPATNDTVVEPTGDETLPVVVAIEPEKPMTLDEGEKIFVEKIVVDESDQDTQDELARIVGPYQNRDLSMVEINEVARKVTRYYRNRGYIVAKAYVPKQDAREGVLVIEVALGSYGRAVVKNNSRLRDRMVEGMFSHLRNGSEGVTSQRLERTMLLVREMPGGAMPNVTLASGKEQGTTDMQVQVGREGRRYQGYLLGDDQGSRFTGRKRLFGELDVNSPLGYGDKLSISGMLSEGENLHNARVSYGVPLNYSGLRLSVAATRTTYALGGSYSALNATGSMSAIEGTLSYPLLRRSDSNIDLSLNIAHRNLHDDLSAVSVFNPRTAEVGSVTLQRTKFGTVLGHRFYTSTAATVTVGELNAENATEAKSSGTDGDYSKLVISLQAETPLYRALSARASLVMQKDLRTKYLDSSEQLFISGSGGVRGYVEGSSGDNGYIFTAELPYTLPAPARTRVRHTISALFDSGGVRAEKNGTTLTDYVLNDVGVGYTATLYPLYFKVQGVRALGNIHSETSKTRIWLQLGVVF